MADPTVVINLAAEYTGEKAFSKADQSTKRLIKNVKNLAATFGLAFSTRAVVQYAAASAKAAAQDQKSQKILASNLNNLGLAYATSDAETFIKSLETQAHIADDVLRPAYAQLAQTTNSVALTQKVMGIAFDTSSATGLDFASTVNILSQAYVGNRKGLKQLNTGLTQAQLAALSFDDLLLLLTKHFQGAGKTAVSGYQGQLDALNISLGNVQEILGGALLDSFAKLAGNGDITTATSNLEKMAQAFADIYRLMTGVTKFGAVMKGIEWGGFLGAVPRIKAPSTVAGQSPGDRLAIDKANKAALAKKAADAAQLAATKKATAAQTAAAKNAALAAKNQAALTKAAAAFDLKQISIANALKETYDKDTKLRLLAMQAIENDNGAAALDYLKQLNILQTSVQADKLKGIEGISDASLHAINVELLAELQSIETSKMSEAAKDEAKMAAYAKYNDAITKQGELMALGYYDERTQVELTYIAKRAALDNYGSAQATLTKITLSADMAAIDEVSMAQALADESRTNSMIAYIALIDEAKWAAFDLAAATAAAASEQAYAITALAEANAGAQAIADAASAASAIAAAEAAATAAAIIAAVTPTVPGTDIPTVPGTDIPQLPVPDYGGALSGINLSPTRANDAYGSTTVNITTGPLIGTEETIADAVQLAMQTLNRRGASVSYAGAI